MYSTEAEWAKLAAYCKRWFGPLNKDHELSELLESDERETLEAIRKHFVYRKEITPDNMRYLESVRIQCEKRNIERRRSNRKETPSIVLAELIEAETPETENDSLNKQTCVFGVPVNTERLD